MNWCYMNLDFMTNIIFAYIICYMYMILLSISILPQLLVQQPIKHYYVILIVRCSILYTVNILCNIGKNHANEK